MKKNLIAISFFSLLLCAAPAHADLLYWSGTGSGVLGGAGTWNTTLARFGTNVNGPYTNVWVNAATNDVLLTGTNAVAGTNVGGGSVLIGAAITMRGTLNWEQTPGALPSYALNGSSTMTFNPGSALIGPATGSSSFNSPYAGTITKSGAGTIIFNNSNGNVTKFILTQGTSTFSAPNRFGSGTDTNDFITLNGGVLRADTVGWGSFGKSISLGAASSTIAGSASTVTMVADKPITSTGGGRLTISSAQFTLLNVSNSWTGPMTISGTGGKLTLGAAGVIPDTCVVTCSSTLAFTNLSETISSLSGAGTVSLGGSATLILANGRNVFTGVITGSGGLTKQGTSTQVLTGGNGYTGTTLVSAGGLALWNPVADTLPFSPIVLAAGASLNLSNLTQTIIALSGAGSIMNTDAPTLTVNGNLTTGSGFNGYSCFSGTLTNGSLVKDGTHAMALRGSNTFEGPLTLLGGTLSVGAAPDRLPTTLALSVPPGVIFQLDANKQTVASLTGNGSVNLGGGTLTTANTAGPDAFNGVIQESELPGASTAIGHGLRGYYYDNIDMTSLLAVRDDATVNFSDLTLAAQLPAPIYPNTNQVSVRWLGQVLTTAAGTYTFTTTCDDGQRLWVNGVQLVDDWAGHAATSKSGSISLAANTRYDIVMEWFNGTGLASAKLAWTPPGDPVSVIIPTEYLFLPTPGTLVKTGIGTQQLGTPNTYSSGTRVLAGTLDAQADGALGVGNVAVEDGATLQLDSSATINTNADLNLNGVAPVVTLNFSGTNDIHGLSLNGGTNHQPAGVYGPTGSGATYESGLLTGLGYLNVLAAPSTNTLTTSASPAVYGSSVNLTSTITGGGATPTGTVSFYDSANFLGTSALNGSGVATLSVNRLSVPDSPHAVTAVYSGDTAYASSASGAASITTTPATVSPSIVVSNKVYDATTNATIASSSSFTGLVAGDSNYVHVVGTATAFFQTKTVGTSKPVDVTGIALSGSLAGNYVLSTSTASVFADITARPLAVTGLAGVNRVYDGTTNATFTGSAALSNVVSGDVVTLGGSPVASFATKTVGNNKTVTINGYTLGGADAGNYSLAPPTLTANITALNLTITGLTADNKVYDGLTNATLSGTAVLNGVISPDVVTLTGTATASFATKTVANAKPVTVKGYTISGADTNNYTLSQPAGLTANITAASTTSLLASSANPSIQTSNVTFTLTITSTTTTADPPTGIAVFLTNGVLAATPALVSNTPTSSKAVFTTALLPLGTNNVAGQYAGDVNFFGFNTNLLQVVQSGVACSQTNAILSMTPGVPGTFVLTLVGTPQAQYYVVAQTNLLLTMSNWTVLAGSTNTVTNLSGLWSFTVTNVTDKRFYRSVAVQVCP